MISIFIWDFTAETVLGQIVEWLYSKVVEGLTQFFALMGNMGVELFDYPWVEAIVMDLYRYPDNLKAKPTLWLWALKDVGIIGIGAVISFFALAKTGFAVPLALIVAYAILTIRVNNSSIMDFMIKAFRFLLGRRQSYVWRLIDDE